MRRFFQGAALLAVLLLTQRVDAAEPGLSFVKGDDVKTLGLSELRRQLPVEELAFFDPEYGKQKKYRGFALGKLLELGFGGWQGDDYTEMVFTALDGYAAVTNLEKLGEPGGFLVFEDSEVPGWEPVGRQQANPGPFYLVWTGPGQTTAREYPWPWQLVKIELIKFATRYPQVFPAGAKQDTPAHAGFLIFKGRCMRCHAMNQQGGLIGPDLNAPQSITAYRAPAMLKAFIRQPSQFRYSQMPDHTDLTDADLNNLLEYFRHMDRQRKQAKP